MKPSAGGVRWAVPVPRTRLAVRCLGEITHEKRDILREADAVYIDQIRKGGL